MNIDNSALNALSAGMQKLLITDSELGYELSAIEHEMSRCVGKSWPGTRLHVALCKKPGETTHGRRVFSIDDPSDISDTASVKTSIERIGMGITRDGDDPILACLVSSAIVVVSEHDELDDLPDDAQSVIEHPGAKNCIVMAASTMLGSKMLRSWEVELIPDTLSIASMTLRDDQVNSHIPLLGSFWDGVSIGLQNRADLPGEPGLAYIRGLSESLRLLRAVALRMDVKGI